MNNEVQNVRFASVREYNLGNLIFIKTVKQPSCELSNKHASNEILLYSQGKHGDMDW